MAYRIAFYLLVAVVGVLGATGLGLFDRGEQGQVQSAAVAAPLAADNNGDNSSSDNDSDSGNGNGADNGGDNGSDNGSAEPGPTPTPTPVQIQAPAPAPQPQPQPQPPVAGPCQFVLGFLVLHTQLQGADGECVDNEHDDPNGTGDRVQTTTRGYMVWQKATNTMRWTDGYRTYTFSSCGLQPRLNTQSWVWEQNPGMVIAGIVPPGGCALGG